VARVDFAGVTVATDPMQKSDRQEFKVEAKEV